MKRLAIVAALMVAATNAVSISWTGYGGDNQWTNTINWSPDQVPGTDDDVTIASGIVQVTIPTGVNSLVMGTSFSAPANLTVFQSFFIGTGGMQVEGNGNLFINSGSASVSGQVTIGGNLYFQSGQISGQWTINTRGVADLSGAAEKVLTGCQFISSATSFGFSGVLVLNQSSQVIVRTAVVFSGDASVQAQDSTSVLFDSSLGTLTYSGNGDFQIMAPFHFGVFDFIGGNVTIYDEVAFVNPLVIPSGSFVSSVGTAVANFSAGVRGAGVLTGAGSNLILGNTTLSGAVNVVGGNVTFVGAGSTIGTLTISGGYLVLNNQVAATQLNFLAGNVVGSSTLTAAQLYLSSAGFNLDSAVVATKSAAVGGLLAFGSTGALTIGSAATLTTLASITFTGAPGPTVTNLGNLSITAPTVFQNINLEGSGNLYTSTTVFFQTATLTQTAVILSGAGIFKGANTRILVIGRVAASTAPSVSATIGAFSFTCPTECDDVSTSGTPTDNFNFSS
ncbi:Hypothetical protein, putative [Bodo saltans]|uniref:Membrane-associated protein n=1 Tax=Bodo saltans TaxID=75058 RepID=A0A0S4JRD9_BODSA|nr:Hypothetical protein, putative [Bodo saltans]|eukprot:CUG92769.1 Hypothetical protein, putative [Bodo saltans]